MKTMGSATFRSEPLTITRKVIKQVSQILLVMVMLGIFASPAYSCYCGAPRVSRAFKKASAVFVGEVTEIIPPSSRTSDASATDHLFKIKFRVGETWKGVSTREVVVLSAQGENCLAYPAVQKGERYLVYADPLYDGEAYSKDLITITSCNRTAMLSLASEIQPASEWTRSDGSKDLKFLDQLAKRSRIH